MKARVEQIQSRFAKARDLTMDAVVELIGDIEKSQATAASADLDLARNYQRKAQFFLDYVEAENSMGFHASGESLRILTESANAARLGQLALRGYREPPPVRAPGRSKEAPQPVQKASAERP